MTCWFCWAVVGAKDTRHFYTLAEGECKPEILEIYGAMRAAVATTLPGKYQSFPQLWPPILQQQLEDAMSVKSVPSINSGSYNFRQTEGNASHRQPKMSTPCPEKEPKRPVFALRAWKQPRARQSSQIEKERLHKTPKAQGK